MSQTADLATILRGADELITEEDLRKKLAALLGHTTTSQL